MTDKVRCKCPKCGSNDLLAHQLSRHATTTRISDGVIDGEPENERVIPSSVRLECPRCEYSWTFRGITEVWELVR